MADDLLDYSFGQGDEIPKAMAKALPPQSPRSFGGDPNQRPVPPSPRPKPPPSPRNFEGAPPASAPPPPKGMGAPAPPPGAPVKPSTPRGTPRMPTLAGKLN